MWKTAEKIKTYSDVGLERNTCVIVLSYNIVVNDDKSVTVGLTTGDDFRALTSSSMTPKIELVTISTVLVLAVLMIKNNTRNKDFQPKLGLKKMMKRRIWKVLYVDQRDFFL